MFFWYVSRYVGVYCFFRCKAFLSLEIQIAWVSICPFPTFRICLCFNMFYFVLSSRLRRSKNRVSFPGNITKPFQLLEYGLSVRFPLFGYVFVFICFVLYAHPIQWITTGEESGIGPWRYHKVFPSFQICFLFNMFFIHIISVCRWIATVE